MNSINKEKLKYLVTGTVGIYFIYFFGSLVQEYMLFFYFIQYEGTLYQYSNSTNRLFQKFQCFYFGSINLCMGNRTDLSQNEAKLKQKYNPSI